jgi:hypothetical protein
VPVRVVFRLPPLSGYDYFITWRGGDRLLWLPNTALELSLLKPELRFEVAVALSSGDTRLERLAAVSARNWRELYALARSVEYENPPQPPAAMWYADLDLAAVAAERLSKEYEVLLEVPQLGDLQAALLAGCSVTVCVAASSRALEAASRVERCSRGAARSLLRSIGLLGGAWDESTLPKLERSNAERGTAQYAVFEEYIQSGEDDRLTKLQRPELRELDPLLDLAFGADADAAFALLRDVATGPLPLRSVPELGQYAPLLRDLIAYGYATVERDVVRLTEKGLFSLLQKMDGAGGLKRV